MSPGGICKSCFRFQKSFKFRLGQRSKWSPHICCNINKLTLERRLCVRVCVYNGLPIVNDQTCSKPLYLYIYFFFCTHVTYYNDRERVVRWTGRVFSHTHTLCNTFLRPEFSLHKRVGAATIHSLIFSCFYKSVCHGRRGSILQALRGPTCRLKIFF